MLQTWRELRLCFVEPVFESIALGVGFAFAAGVQPGPLQAFLFSRAVATGWKRTLPAALSPLLSDLPIAILVLLVLGQLPPVAQQLLRIAGGALLMWLAWATIRSSEKPAETVDDRSAPRTFLQAALVNVLNPNPYLGWALILGPAFVMAWRTQPASGVALLVAFYGTLVVMNAATIVLFGTARFLTVRVQHAILIASALILAALGAYQLVIGVLRLRGA